MDKRELAWAKLQCRYGKCYINERNANFTQIAIQTETVLKNMIEIKVLKLKVKVLKYFWNKSWSKSLK